MKVRIIECTQGGDTWWEVQTKSFLFWITVRDAFGHICYFYSLRKAEEEAEGLKCGIKRKVIREDEQ